MKNFNYILLSVLFVFLGTSFVYAQQDVQITDIPQSLKCYVSDGDNEGTAPAMAECQPFNSTQRALYFVYEADSTGILTVAVGQQNGLNETNEQNQPTQDVIDIVLEFYDSNYRIRKQVDVDEVGQEITFFKIPHPGTYYIAVKPYYGTQTLPDYLAINSSWTPYPHLIPDGNDSGQVGPDGKFLPIVATQDLLIGIPVSSELTQADPLDIWVTQFDLDPNLEYIVMFEAESFDVDIALRAYQKFNVESLQSADNKYAGETESLTYTPTGQGPIYLEVVNVSGNDTPGTYILNVKLFTMQR